MTSQNHFSCLIRRDILAFCSEKALKTAKEPAVIYFDEIKLSFIVLHIFTEQNECRAGIASCQHLCIDTGNGYNCACHKGYKLEGRYKCQGKYANSYVMTS